MPRGQLREIRIEAGEKVYQCSRCRSWKTKPLMSKRADGTDGVSSWCRRCRNNSTRRIHAANPAKYDARDKKHYQDNKAAVNKRTSASLSANKDRARATQALCYAVKHGHIIKPSECEMCGCTDRRVIGHHDSYEADRHLVVIWVCDPCHGWIHARRREQCQN